MSEIAYYRTAIRIPQAQIVSQGGNLVDKSTCNDILRRAFELVMEDHGGEICTEVTDADNEKIPCVMAVRTPEVPLGVGVQFDRDGLLSFVFESRYNRAEAERVAGEISLNYNTIALQKALNQMNIATEIEVVRSAQGIRVEMIGSV